MEYVSPTQLTEMLGLSRKTIESWIAQRKIEFIRIGRSIAIPMHEAQRLLDERSMPKEKRP